MVTHIASALDMITLLCEKILKSIIIRMIYIWYILERACLHEQGIWSQATRPRYEVKNYIKIILKHGEYL